MRILIALLNLSAFFLMLEINTFENLYYYAFLEGKKHVDKFNRLDNWIMKRVGGRPIKNYAWFMSKKPLGLLLLLVSIVLGILVPTP